MWPYRTTVEQLRALGFDLQSSLHVTLIPYPQLTGRLAPDRGVPFEAIDPGIRDCIVARLVCQAYEFHRGRETTRREGDFLLDFLNFRGTTREIAQMGRRVVHPRYENQECGDGKKIEGTTSQRLDIDQHHCGQRRSLDRDSAPCAALELGWRQSRMNVRTKSKDDTTPAMPSLLVTTT